MTLLPELPMSSSLPPRPRISSSPSLPKRISGPSVPESRPPLGQPGTSFVTAVSSSHLMVRVPSHRGSSDVVASGERPCSFVASLCPCFSSCEDSALTPDPPITRRRTAHPIRKAPTTAMRCPWRTTAHPPSLCMYPPLLTPHSVPHNEARRI